MITVTDMAVRQLQQMLAEKGEPSKGLRIYVEQGGCAGMQYGMTLDEPSGEDAIHEQGGVKVVIDRESLNYLQGSTLDYCDDLTGTGFRLHNPNAVRSCGCGTSFEPPESDAASQGAPHAH